MTYLLLYLLSIVTIGLFTVKVFPKKKHLNRMEEKIIEMFPSMKEEYPHVTKSEESLKVYYSLKMIVWPLAWVMTIIYTFIFLVIWLFGGLLKYLGDVIKPSDAA